VGLGIKKVIAAVSPVTYLTATAAAVAPVRISAWTRVVLT